MSTATQELLANREYKYGFTTDIETETIPKGLSEDVVRLISSKKNEPQWLLGFSSESVSSLAENGTAGQLGEFRLSEY